jgi:hypothetical protein
MLTIREESFIGKIPIPAVPSNVAAVPAELIQHVLQEAGLSSQDIRAILRAPEWHGLNPRNERILFLFDFLVPIAVLD